MEIQRANVNSKMFQPSVWDDFPMKRNNKLMNYIIQSDFEMDIPEKIKLPKEFEFTELNINEDSEKIAEFLNQHYFTITPGTTSTPGTTININDHDKLSSGKIMYSDEYIEFLYKSPKKHFKKLRNISIDYWLIGLIDRSNNDLYGFISARPMTYYIDGRVINGMFIDKLCTHVKYRGRKMAIVLLKEMYRKLKTVENECACIFNTSSDLPFQGITQKLELLEKSFVRNEQQLKENLAQIDELTRQRNEENDPDVVKRINHKISELQSVSIVPTGDIHQIRLANKRDTDELMKIYYNYTGKYRFYRVFNKKEFEHRFLPRKDLVYTYVLTNSSGEVKDFITINVLFDDKGRKIAYVYYISFFNNDLLNIFMKNILFILQESDFDKVLCYESFGVSETLKQSLDFVACDVKLPSAFYAFNYNTKTISQKECGLTYCI